VPASDLSRSSFFKFPVVVWISPCAIAFFSVYRQHPDSMRKGFHLFGEGGWSLLAFQNKQRD
jgi:hypothetical protein